MQSRLRMVAFALVAQAGLLCWLYAPLLPHVATHLPRTSYLYDILYIGWALAHQSRALVSDPLHYAEANIFHPDHHTLFYGEAGFGALPLFMPAFLSTGNPTLALNCVLLGGLAATAAALHVVVQSWTRSFIGGLIAGATFLMTPYVSWGGLAAAPNYAVLPYFPLIVLAAATPDASWAVATTLLVLVVAQSLTSVYVAVALLVPLAILALWRMTGSQTRRAGLRLLVTIGLALLVLALPYGGYAVLRAHNPDWSRQSAWPVPGSFPLDTLSVVGIMSPTGVPVSAVALIGAGFVLYWGRRRRGPATPRTIWVHGAFWTIAGTILSLRPAMRWHGQIVALLPHGLVTLLAPFWQLIRFPERLAIAGLMGLAVLSGASAAEITAWVVRSRACRCVPASVAGAAIAATLVLVLLPVSRLGAPVFGLGLPPWPRPIVRAPEPDAPFMALLSAPGGPLLELPIDTTPEPQVEAMYRSIFHRRALLNGYSGYWPARFPERRGLAMRLPDPDALAALSRLSGLAVIWVHTDALVPAQRERWLALAEGAEEREDLRLLARAGPDLLFECSAFRRPAGVPRADD